MGVLPTSLLVFDLGGCLHQVVDCGLARNLLFINGDPVLGEAELALPDLLIHLLQRLKLTVYVEDTLATLAGFGVPSNDLHVILETGQ